MLDAGVYTGLGDEFVRVGACKLMADGSISERTARLARALITTLVISEFLYASSASRCCSGC
jgi:predicted amidohydrolase YtcJ